MFFTVSSKFMIELFLHQGAQSDEVSDLSRLFLYRSVKMTTNNGGTYPLAHFLGNFREITKKVPTRTVSRKLPEISLKVPKKLRALLPLAHFRKGNFSDSRKFLKSPVTTRTL